MRLYCGIDLHSNNSLVSILDETDRVIYEKRLGNDLEVIRGTLLPYREDLLAVVVESTYNWYWLVDGLLESGFNVRLANPVGLRQYSGLKYTDDKTDARYLAHLYRLGILPEGYIYPYEMRCVRDLFRRRLLLVRQRVMQHLSVQSLIARHSGHCLTGSRIRELKGSEIEELLGHPSARLMVSIGHDLMLRLSEAIARIEEQVLAYCKPTHSYELIRSVPGVGRILGQSILLETGPIERFRDANQYASYARCVPSRKISNGKVKGEGNRKNGNKYLGYAYMEAAHYAAIWNPRIQRYYQRKAGKTHKMVAKKAIANKLAKACFHMLVGGERFDIDRAFA